MRKSLLRTDITVFSVVVVDLPTDYILIVLFPAETDVLVPVFSQSTDVVVVVLKFPNVNIPQLLIALSDICIER